MQITKPSMAKLRALVGHSQASRHPFRTLWRVASWEYIRLTGRSFERPFGRESRIVLFPEDGCARLIHYWDAYDEDVETVLDAVLAPGMTVLDVGANIGAFAILASERVGADGVVVAFEPDPGTYLKLEQNVALNARENVVCVNAAVGASNGWISLSVAEESSRRHVLEVGDAIGFGAIPLVTIDQFLHDNGLLGVDYVKVDVEGYESAVLRGARRALQTRQIRIWQIECLDELQRRYGSSPAEVSHILGCSGYERVRMAGGKWHRLEESETVPGDQYFQLQIPVMPDTRTS